MDGQGGASDGHQAAAELRRRLAAGQDPGDWLAPAVAAEIRRRGLYGSGPGPRGV